MFRRVQKKNAFTLVEVLAIIIVIAIIALISVPNISGYIKKTKEQSFRTSIDSLIHAYEYKNIDYGEIGRVSACSLDVNECNMDGYIEKDEDGRIKVYLTDGNNCAIGVSGSYEVKQGDCTKEDANPPEITDIVFSNLTVSSVRVFVDYIEEDLITSIKFRLKDSIGNIIYDWQNADSVDNSQDERVAKKEYSNLEQGKTYLVEVEIKNNAESNNTATYSKQFSTLGYSGPEITYSKNWEKQKIVTITYTDLEEVQNSYRKKTNNLFDLTGWKEANTKTQTVEVSNYHYYVDAKSSVGGTTLTSTAQIGYIDNDEDINNTKPTIQVMDYKNSGAINTNEVSFKLSDTLSGVGSYCVTTTNNVNNCSGTGQNSELNKWVVASNVAEVREKTVQHQIQEGGTYYVFLKDYVGNVSDGVSFTVYKVHYELNGGSGTINDQIKLKDNSLTLTNLEPTKEGYKFIGWGRNVDSHDVDYPSQSEYTTNANITLYAVYRAGLKVTYDSNGGSGTVIQPSMCYKYDEEPSCEITFATNTYTRPGYTFKGWSLTANGAVAYNQGSKHNISDNVTVYAGWEANALTFANQSYTKTFNTSAQTIDIQGASNGNGTYTYSEVSEKKGSTSTNYITIATNGKITLAASTPVGTYTYVVRASSQVSNSINGNTTITKDATITITVSAYDLTESSIGDIAALTFNNSNQTPTPSVTALGVTLVNNTDFTYSYSNNKNVGEGTVTITGKGNYTGTNSKTFTINPYNLSSSTISDITALTYNGKNQTPTPSVTALGVTLSSTNDFTYSYSSNKDAGTGTVTVSGKGNYTGSKSKTFTINPKNITVTWSNTSLTFNNANQKPTASVSTGVTNETMTLSISGEKKDVGSYTASVTCSSVTTNNKCDNYEITNPSTSFDINAYNLSNATIDNIASVDYDGTEHKPTPAVTALNMTLVNGTNYTYSYANNINAGTATVTVTGKGNYTGTKSKTFTINRVSATSNTVTCGSLTYNGTNQSLISTTNISNGSVYYKIGTELTSSNYTTGSTTKPTAKDAGSYVVYYYAPADNYTETKGSVTCSIAAKSIAVSWSNTSLTYNESTQKPTASVTTGVTNETMTLSVSGAQTNVGSYTATATCSSITTNNKCGNYTLSNASTSFSIGKANPTMSLSPTSGSLVVGVSNGTITVSGSNYGTLSCSSSNTSYATCSVSGTTVTVVPKGTGTATITVTGSGNSNYNSISKTYTATVSSDATPPTCSFTVTSSGVTLTRNDNIGVTAYGLTTTNSVNYNSTQTGTLSNGTTYYGWVKDAAGNTGSCSVTIGGTTPSAYTKKSKTCSYTSTSASGSYYSSSTYSCTTYDCGQSGCSCSYSASGSYTTSASCTASTCSKSGCSCTTIPSGKYPVTNTCTTTDCGKRPGCSCTTNYTITTATCKESNCKTYKYATNCSTSTVSSCSTSGTDTCGASMVTDCTKNGKKYTKTTCTLGCDTHYNCSYSNSTSTSTGTSCSAGTLSCNKNTAGTSAVVGCSAQGKTASGTYETSATCTTSTCSKTGCSCTTSPSGTYETSAACTTSTCGKSGCSCSATSASGTYTSGGYYTCTASTCNKSGCSCTDNYAFGTETTQTNQTSCTANTVSTCNSSNSGKTNVTCTVTAYACANSGYTKINDSYCYKIN